ncbi:MAG TPA: glycosyl hydrolase family 65 protein [Syntrophales bacterium]|nr:glycosyl hydrolase family 65 protein [Syntrophales bacterium]
MDSWTLVYNKFEPEQEALREALCTLGNGYFATRGASAQADADGTHYPGTYLAGGYNRLKTEIAGRVIENEDLVNLPNWLVLKFRLDDGPWFAVKDAKILKYRQELRMKEGLLAREIRFRDGQGRVTVLRERRLVHMGSPHLAGLETTVTADNWSGRVEFESGLDGRVINDGVARYRELNSRHLETLETDEIDHDTIFLKVQTNQSELRIAQAARTAVFKNGESLRLDRLLVQEEDYIAQRFTVDLSKGRAVRIEKIVALHTSRDHASSECGLEAGKTVQRCQNFKKLVKSQSHAWRRLWRRFAMTLKTKEKNSDTLTILNLNIFHLLQSTSLHTMDLDVGVPSRGWHGEAYRGHIFWDELFIFPFLNLRVPEITRALLMYRYRRLDEARAAAREEGHRGAMYPWQSGSNGREESQKVHLNPESGRWIRDNSRLQRHVSAAIAYNICQYYQATEDREFLSFYGAEMMFEIARFWSSKASYNESLGRYEIRGVMGPDEYHDSYPNAEEPGLDNSAYTNVMAAWVLTEALKLLDLLSEDRRRELCDTIDLGEDEIERWKDIRLKMYVPFHGDGIISQFSGYDDLKEFDWKGYREKYGDIQRLDRILEAENDTPNRYKASKQADVLMLFYLFSAEELGALFKQLGYPFEYETIPKNIEYYIQRTSHGSTLSRVVHAWVLARSDREQSWDLCRQALRSDYTDIQGGTTPEGIHLGAMAGSINIIQEAYTGIEQRGGVLWFNPCLPRELESLHMVIHYRGHTLEIDVTGEALTVHACRCPEKPIRIGFDDEVYELEERQRRVFSRSS